MNRNLNSDFCNFFFTTGIDKILSREGFSPDKKAPNDKGTPQPSNKVINVSGLGIPEGIYIANTQIVTNTHIILIQIN